VQEAVSEAASGYSQLMQQYTYLFVLFSCVLDFHAVSENQIQAMDIGSCFSTFGTHYTELRVAAQRIESLGFASIHDLGV
jgi:hypothetical protein